MASVSAANSTKNVRADLTRNETFLLSSLSEKGRTIFRLKDVSGELKCSYEYMPCLSFKANPLTGKLEKHRALLF